jgi:DNA-binding transcriptional regulator YiaG
MDFAQTVKEIRIKLNMSQEQLARELHVSFATVNRWENGKNSPNMIAKKELYDFCKKKGLEEALIKHLLDY